VWTQEGRKVKCRRILKFLRDHNIRYWPIADIMRRSANARYWARTGRPPVRLLRTRLDGGPERTAPIRSNQRLTI